MRRSSVDTLSPRSHCFSKPERSLAKPSASRCITAATSLSASLTVPRGSSTKQVCILIHCDRNSPISDSENKGIDSQAADARSKASDSRPFTSLGPSSCFGAPFFARSAVVSSPSMVLSSSIMPPLSFLQSLVPAPVLQIENGSESSLFLDLPCLLGLSQAVAQSHAQSGSSPPLWDDQQKCRRHVDRNRIRDSHGFS